MKTKLVNRVRKLAAVATGAMFLGATFGAASVFAVNTLSNLPAPFVSGGAVHAVVVIGAAAQSIDVVGGVDLAAAMAAAAAAQHSGSGSYATIGATSVSGKTLTFSDFISNSTLFPITKSVTLAQQPYKVGTGKSALNYTAYENATAFRPKLWGRNVLLPISSYGLVSYTKNVSSGKNVVLNLTTPVLKSGALEFLVGSNLSSNLFTALNVSTGHNMSFGATATYGTEALPFTASVGGNSVAVLGTAQVGTYSGYVFEVSVNGGSTVYVNQSTTKTVASGAKPVVVTTGLRVSNTSGTYMTSLTVSGVSFVQNNSARAVSNFGSGLSAFNITFGNLSGSNKGGYVKALNTANKNLTLSATSLLFPFSLSNISLTTSTPVWDTHSDNVTVTTGASASETLNSGLLFNTSTLTVNELNYTTSLSGVSFGTDFRQSAVLNATGNGLATFVPDGLLESYQNIHTSLYGNFPAKSEFVYPLTISGGYGNTTARFWTNTSNGAMNFTALQGSAPVRIVYQLPNGRYIALKYTAIAVAPVVSGTKNNTVWNVTAYYNYTASGAGSATPVSISGNKTYSFNGYNMTVGAAKLATRKAAGGALVGASVPVTTVTLNGPVVSVTDTGGGSWSVVPGYSGLYFSTNGTTANSVALSHSYLGSLAFNNSAFTLTEPNGKTLSVSVKENNSDFRTYFPSVVNTTADTWGGFVNAKIKNFNNQTSAGNYLMNVPTWNYTVAVGGTTTQSGTNYTVGQTVPAGKLLGLGSGTSLSASGLFPSNIANAAVLDSSFTGSTNTQPVVVVGGSAVSTVAAALLGLPFPTYGSSSAWLNATGVHSGHSLVELFNNASAVGHEPALLVAGYAGADTLLASEVVAEALVGTPVSGVTLNGTKVILSSGSGSYNGVTGHG